MAYKVFHRIALFLDSWGNLYPSFHIARTQSWTLRVESEVVPLTITPKKSLTKYVFLISTALSSAS